MNTEFAQLKMEDLRKELPEMVRSLEAYRQVPTTHCLLKLLWKNWYRVNMVYHRMPSLKSWALIRRLIQCRTSSLCRNRISVGLYRKSSVLLLQLVCVRHLSTRTSLLQTNQLMVAGNYADGKYVGCCSR